MSVGLQSSASPALMHHPLFQCVRDHICVCGVVCSVFVCVQYLSFQDRFSLLITESKGSDCFISIIAINN